MSVLKDKLVAIIRQQVQSSVASPSSSYRIATVASLNDDGTCNVLVDGNGMVATPLYPVILGMEVMVVIDAQGRASAIPTKPNTAPTDIIHPPYFTGGAIVAAWPEGDAGTSAIRFQAAGNNKIFRWIIPLAGADLRWVTPTGGAFSPNGQYFGYGGSMQWDTGVFQNQGAVPFGTNTKVAVIKLGPTFKPGDPISAPQGFLLTATEPIQILVPGFDLVAGSFPVVNQKQLYRFTITGVFVSNDGKKVFWVEYLALTDLTYNAFNQITNENEFTLVNFCTAINGVRTVLASLPPYQMIGGSAPTGPIQGSGYFGVESVNDLSSVFIGGYIFDPVNETSDPNAPAKFYLAAEQPFNFPTSGQIAVPIGHAVLNFFPFTGTFGISDPPPTPVLSLDFGDSPDHVVPSQIITRTPTFSRTYSALLDRLFINLSSSNPVYLIAENRKKGTFKQYTVTPGANGIVQFVFGDSDNQRGAITADPANINNAIIMNKVKTDDTALTIVVQDDMFVVTPNPPDTALGFTKFNFRTAEYDDFLIAQFPLALGIQS